MRRSICARVCVPPPAGLTLLLLLLLLPLHPQGLSAIVPVLPGLATNFFASRRAGVQLDCEALSPEPPACQVCVGGGGGGGGGGGPGGGHPPPGRYGKG
jgi:hypothetical protein